MIIAAIVGIILLAVVGLFLLTPAPKIVTGVAAKRACSCHFLAGRSPEYIAANENNYSLIKLAKITYDEQQKTATATFLGLGKLTAAYRDGLGCAIVTENYPIEKVQASSFAIPKAAPMPDVFADSNFAAKPDFDTEKLNRAVEKAFEGKKKTRAVVIVKDGQIIAEKYSAGLDESSLLLGWSMTKSITSAMAGVMVQKGMIDIDKPVGIPEWQEDERTKITWNNLLQMCSGLKWNENYFWVSDVTKMLAMRGDMYQHAIQSKAKFAPEKKFLYSSGTTNIVAGLQRRQFADIQSYWAFPYRELFHKIGMNSAIMETDASGTFVGSSYSFATARDWAKFGMLYLNDGVWQGERILPEGWAAYTAKTAPGSEGDYGSFFWLNAGEQYPDAPREAYGAQGFQGQYVYVVPSQNLVVVRLGTGIGDMDFNEFLTEIVASCASID